MLHVTGDPPLIAALHNALFWLDTLVPSLVDRFVTFEVNRGVVDLTMVAYIRVVVVLAY